MIKLTALLLLLYLPLHATHLPNWSFDDAHQGWNSEILSKIYFHNSETQRQWAWELLGKYRFKGNERVLDFGCGDGKITAEIARLASNGNVLGVDLSAEMVHLAHIKFPPYAYPNLAFKQNSLSTEDFLKDEYDLICSFAVFHLLKEPVETLKNFKRHLKPSGKILMGIPADTNPSVYQAALETFAKYSLDAPWGKNNGKTMRTVEGCSEILKEAGFTIESLEVVDTENSFYDLEELIMWMIGTGTANWNIPFSLSRSFFTDLVHRIYELEPSMIDQEGRVRFKTLRINLVAT